jgi:disulfide bond formation protein DsbB
VLLASAVGASVTSVGVDIMTPSKGGSMPTAGSCAPDNFWTLLGDLVSMGGWLLILVIVVPMVLGWLLPGPLERAKKKRK